MSPSPKKPRWKKGASVSVRHEGKIHQAQVEDIIPPPNDFGYVHAKYKLFLPDYMGGRGQIIVAEMDKVMPSREANERSFEPGDRVNTQYGPAIVVAEQGANSQGDKLYEVKLANSRPSMRPGDKGTTVLVAGYLEPELDIPTELVLSDLDERPSVNESGPKIAPQEPTVGL